MKIYLVLILLLGGTMSNAADSLYQQSVTTIEGKKNNFGRLQGEAPSCC